MAEAKKPTKKIIDVKHPGQTAPSGTSKSVIVTNRPIMKDPMVVDDEAKAEETATAPTYKSGGEAVIKPLGDKEPAKPETDKSKTISELAEEANAKPKSDDKKEPEIKLPIDEDQVKGEADKDQKTQETDDKTPDPKDEPTSVEAEKLPVEKDETDEDEPHKDTTKPDLGDDKKDSDIATKDIEDPEAAQEDKELKKRKAEVTKLAESKKFYLPITTVENRNNRRAVVIGVVVSILLVVGWLNIALDAGLVKMDGLPHTKFFASTTQTTESVIQPDVNTYTTKVTKVSFKYPAGWKLNSQLGSTDNDLVSVDPKPDQEDLEKGIVYIQFMGPRTIKSNDIVTVKYVKYQKLPKKIGGKTVYLRDLVFEGEKGKIDVNSALTNNNNIEVGAKTSPYETFQNPDGKTTSEFRIFDLKTTNKVAGFSTVEGAKDFINSPVYKTSRAILFSTR